MPITDLLSLWDQLLEAFGAASAAAAGSDAGALHHAIRRGRNTATELYMTLDPTRHPELSTHVHGVLDMCMVQLDRAARDAAGDQDGSGFDVPMGLLAAMRASLMVAHATRQFTERPVAGAYVSHFPMPAMTSSCEFVMMASACEFIPPAH